MSSLPDFRSRDFLLGHISQIMDFYYPACINEADGGYFNEYRDDGRITDRATQHLVSTTRFIFNFSTAAGLLGRPEFARGRRARLALSRRCPSRQRIRRLFLGDGPSRSPRDPAKQCYGHAFVLLAYASALKAGIPGMHDKVNQTYDLLEARFWSRRAPGLRG